MSKSLNTTAVVATEVEIMDLDLALAALNAEHDAASMAADEPAPSMDLTEADLNDIEAAAAIQAAYLAQPAEAQAPAQAEASDEADEEDDTRSFADQMADVTEHEMAQMQHELLAAFTTRATFEKEANPTNDNIQKTLSKLIKSVTPGMARATVVNNRGVSYINVSEVAGKRRNVYALDKLRDLVYGAVTGHPSNAINLAVLKSLVTLADHKLPFTGAVAKACASDKMAIENHYKAFLYRHTVSESTASTQSSSTMTAMEDLGVVVNKGTQKSPVWELTTTPMALRLVEVARKLMAPVVAV